MAMIDAPPLMFSSPLLDAAPEKIKLDHRRSNREVSGDQHDEEEPKQCATLVSASTSIFTEQEDAAETSVHEISASEEDSDSDASFFFGSASSFKKKALAAESAEMPQELKELARLVELHQRAKKHSVQTSRRKFDFDWILARASPALKAHIHLKRSLATYKRSPFNAIVQSQWYYDFRMYREQVCAELKATGSATSSSLTPPFAPMANTKMPLVLQELAHVLEVHDYNFRPGKQGQISWHWVQAVSSSALVKHILRKQNDPNVRKSYKKCPTAALVPSTHYAEFRNVRSRIWNQLVNHPPAKTDFAPTATPMINKTPLKVKKLSSKTPLPVKKFSKKSSATLTPKGVFVNAPRARKSTGSPRVSPSGLSVEQRELARLMEAVRRNDKTKRVVFDKEYIHAHASPALSAYIAERAQLPTFQKNIMRALVSVNKKNAWEAFRLQVRERMDKGEPLDDLMERNDHDLVMTLDDEDEDEDDELESEVEFEPEVIISPTPSRPVVVDMRHHAMDAYWLAPSQRLEILKSIDAGAMVMGDMSKRRLSGNLPISKRPRRTDLFEQVASSDRKLFSEKLVAVDTEGVDADSIAFIKSVVAGDNPLPFGLMDLALKIEQSALHGGVDWDIVMDRVNPPTRELIMEHRWTPGFSANPELFLISISSVVPFCDVRLKLKNALRA